MGCFSASFLHVNLGAGRSGVRWRGLKLTRLCILAMLFATLHHLPNVKSNKAVRMFEEMGLGWFQLLGSKFPHLTWSLEAGLCV